MSTPSSCGKPIFSASVFAFSAVTNWSKIGRCTYTRSEHRQTWPELVNDERSTPATAASKSASANTTAAFLPPSSNETSFTPSATAFMMALPVFDSPVKVSIGGLGQVGEGAEVGDAARNVERAGLMQRASSIGDFGRDEFLEAGLDAVSDLVQQRRAFLHAQLAPGAGQRRLRGLDRGV